MKLVCFLWVFAVSVFGQDDKAAEHYENTGLLKPVSEAPIKLVHLLNPGEREYLSPNLLGLQNIAMTYLPLTMNFINVIDAFREVVNGVRYEILLNAADTKANDAEVVCQLVILEKPWLVTEWGDKVRELLYSNCTGDADNNNHAFGNVKYTTNLVFNGGTRNELTVEEMDKLVTQIQPKSDATTTSTTVSTTQAHVDGRPNVSTASVSNEDTSSEPKELNDDEKKWIDNIFSVGALNFEKSLQKDNNNDPAAGDESDEQTQQQNMDYDYDDMQQQQQQQMTSFETIHPHSKRASGPLVGGSSELEKSEAKSRLQNTLDKIATGGEGPSYKIGKIHSATTQVVSGSLTKIDADLIDKDEKKMRCNVEIWSQPWLANGNEVTIDCPGKDTLKTRHSRSVEYAEKKTHKKRSYYDNDKTEHLFNKFQVKYNRQYHTTMEHQMRLRIFRQNLKTIEELNHNEMGSAKYGITEFADLTTKEYMQRTGLWQRAADQPSKNSPAEIPDIELPKEFDWREKNVISKVKNQGSCGSCWAFSVTGNIEGLHAIRTGHLEEYSEQELLDCDTVDSACNGGLPDNAYEAIRKIGGLELESEYPYEGRKEQCHFNKGLAHVQVKGAVDLPKNETAMAQWLVANGPISIGINANAMQFYRGGVSHPWRALCSHSNLDHGVLIVGYGVSEYPMFKKTLPYWIVKNSWGTKWGEQGYYRVYRGDNSCGVSEMASSAVLA